MQVLTKYGPVEVDVGDKFTVNEYNWTVVSINARDTVDGVYQNRAPVVIVHDPSKPDMSSHEFGKIVVRPGLVCHVLDEMNIKSLIVGQYGAYNAEAAAARLHEQRHGLPYDHVPNYSNTEHKGGIVLSLDTTIDKELELEGLAREIIRSIQNARKKAGLEMADEILLAWETTDALLLETIKELQNHILFEVQATLGDPEAATPQTLDIDKKYKLTIRFKKV